jgi:integrase
MAIKLGLRNVAALKPHSIIWDVAARGFHARRQFGPDVTFGVFYRNVEGVQKWHKIGRFGVFTPSQARDEAQRVLREVALGNDPSAIRNEIKNAMSIAQLCDEYIENGVTGKKASTIKSDLSRIAANIKPTLGQRKVTGVTSEDVEHFMRGLSPGSAKRNVGTLGAIFSYAVKRKLRPDNPCVGVDKPADGKRLRRLSEAEYAALWAALQRRTNIASEVVLFLAVTGWRSSEAKDLRWSELDIERRVAQLGDTKTGLSVRPLSSAAIEIIRRQSAKGEFVFEHSHAKPINNVRPWWTRLGMAKDVSPHVLRHSFASLAADMGLADHLIAGLLGHARQGVTSRYMHLGDKALLEASDLVANETMRLMRCARYE